MGRYHQKNGDYKASLPHALAAARLAEAGGISKEHIAGQWLNAGDVYESIGDYNNAMVCTLRALRFFEESGNRLGESFCYTNISVIYIQLKQFRKALSYAQKSLQLKKILGDRRSVCTALQAVGDAHLGLKNLPLALVNYESALKIAFAEKMPKEQANCYHNIAKILAAQGRINLAVSYFRKSKATAEQLGNKLMMANADMELAILHKNKDSLAVTEKSLVTSLRAFRDAGSLERQSDNYRHLAAFYAANKQYEEALQFSDKHHAFKDSISSIKVQLQLNKLEEEYNSVKKEKEIISLKREKESQKQTLFRQRVMFAAVTALFVFSVMGIGLLVNRNRLRQRVKDLELRSQIAADLHDEVGSSLSSIHLLSQMASGRQGNDASHQDILVRMGTNAKETMNKMGEIVWMIKPGETEAVSLKKQIERFAYELCGSKNIETLAEVDELEKLKLSWDQRKNIYLIFKEALNNAVKYSASNQIQIKANVQNKRLTLLIQDFGKGFNAEIAGTGNGLGNIKNRALELKGQLYIESLPENGTSVRLVIPV